MNSSIGLNLNDQFEIQGSVCNFGNDIDVIDAVATVMQNGSISGDFNEPCSDRVTLRQAF